MAFKTKTFNLLGLILGIACLISIVIAFASDRWVVSTEKEISGFKNIGLWSACFSRYRPPPWALIDKYYDGCWWVFDRELDDLRHFLFPPWFVGTQVLVTISLTFEILAIILMVINSINCFPYNKHKDFIALMLSLTTAVLHGLTAILSTVAIIMFGARADNERTWLEKPDQNYLSWSFGMCVLAAFLSVLAFMSVAVEFYRLRLLRRSNSEPKVLITTIPPPATNYAYGRHNPGFSADQKDSVSRRQPAYASRYSSERSQYPKLPTGEVYVNSSYVNNEERDSRRARYPPYARRQFSPPPSNYGRPVNGKNYSDRDGSLQAKPPGPETNKSNDYEESKTLQQPVLPEYVPKTKSAEDAKKINIDNTVDESCDTDVTKKDLDSSNDNLVDAKTKSGKSKAKEKKNDLDESNDADKKRKTDKDKKKSRSNSKSRKSSKSRSDSAHKKKQARKNDDKKTDARHSKRSKSKGSGNDDSDDDEHSRSRHRSSGRASKKSKRKQSHSRERSSSQHRSHSKDLSSSDSESHIDSDSTSVASRSRKKSRNTEGSSSRKNSRHRSVSRDSQRKKRQDGNYTDDMSGSEYSSKSKSKRKGHQAEPGSKDKAKSRDYSDTESIHSRRSRRGNSNGRKLNKSREYSDTESLPSKRAASLGRQFGRSRNFSDTESVRSKQSRRGNIKAKASYSSYYEY